MCGSVIIYNDKAKSIIVKKAFLFQANKRKHTQSIQRERERERERESKSLSIDFLCSVTTIRDNCFLLTSATERWRRRARLCMCMSVKTNILYIKVY